MSKARVFSCVFVFLLTACFGSVGLPNGQPGRQLLFNFENRNQVSEDFPRVLVPGLTVEIIAGNGNAGYKDGPALDAEFNSPAHVIQTQQGDLLISDAENNRIRKLGADGYVSTIAGSGKEAIEIGNALAAAFFLPGTMLEKKSENTILIANIAGPISELDLQDNSVELFASEIKKATAMQPRYVELISQQDSVQCLTQYQQNLYLCMKRAIYRQTSSGEFEPFIGRPGGMGLEIDSPYVHYRDGNKDEALFSEYMSLAPTPSGDIYIADSSNHVIRKYDAQTQQVSTVAGAPTPSEEEVIAIPLNSKFNDGPLLEAGIPSPTALTYHDSGAFLFTSSGRLRLMTDSHIYTLTEHASLYHLHLSNSHTLYSASHGYIYRVKLNMDTILSYLNTDP